MTVLRVGVLFPTTFNLNADAANGSIIVRRLVLSDLDAEVVPIDSDAIRRRVAVDALIIGSPSSSIVKSAEATSAETRRFVSGVLADAAPVLAVSNGFHLLGKMTGKDGSLLGGLGLVPVATTFGSVQHVTIGAQIDTDWGVVVGIENHNATVQLGDGTAEFGRMLHGVGNGVGTVDGVRYGSLWGTHLHGPVFALNSTLADEFARRVAEHGGQTYLRRDDLDAIDRLAQGAREHLIRKKTP